MKSFIMFLSTLAFAFSAKAEGPLELSPSRTILLAGIIGGPMFGPTMNALDNLAKNKEKPIDMIISSPGGSVMVGSILIDRMEQLKNEGITFRCVVRELAASMAFQILLHCNERYATPGAFLLWHPVRVFANDVITADVAHSLLVQLRAADEVVISDLLKYLPMKKETLMWHFKNETLHQAFNLTKSAPDFFEKVTNNIRNLRPEKPYLDTSKFGGFFGLHNVVYIHERFMQGDKK